LLKTNDLYTLFAPESGKILFVESGILVFGILLTIGIWNSSSSDRLGIENQVGTGIHSLDRATTQYLGKRPWKQSQRPITQKTFYVNSCPLNTPF